MAPSLAKRLQSMLLLSLTGILMTTELGWLPLLLSRRARNRMSPMLGELVKRAISRAREKDLTESCGIFRMSIDLL